MVRLGVDFRGAPLAVREQFSFTAAQAADFLPAGIRAGFAELMVVSTCNRTEFYAVCGQAHDALPILVDAWKQFRPEAQPVYRDCARFQQQGEDALRALFRVASGLESQILGDTHIQTQVRQAMEIARAARTLGPMLQTAAECALHAAKQVRRRTSISAGSAGIGAAVLRSIRKWNRNRLSILVIGAGQAARDIAAHLAKCRGFELHFTARRLDACQEMARLYGGAATPWPHAQAAAARVDAIVTAVSARLDLLSHQSLAAITAGRTRPLLVVDAGVPRNADPAVASIGPVTLLDMDSLECEQAAALTERERQLPAAEAILEEEIERWRRITAWREVEPAVKQLYLSAERLRLDIVSQSGGRDDVDRATGKLMRRLLAGPVHTIRKAIFLAPGDQAAEAASALRQLAPLFGNGKNKHAQDHSS